MNKILVLITFIVFINNSNAEEFWQRLDQPKVDASFWDFFQVDGKTYAWLNDGLFEFKDGEYIYVEDTFFQDKGKIYSLRVEKGKGVMSSEAGVYYLEDNKWNLCENFSNKSQLENLNFIGNKIIGSFHINATVMYSNDNGKTWKNVYNEKDTLKANEMYLYRDTIHSTFYFKYIKIYEVSDSIAYIANSLQNGASSMCILMDEDYLYYGDYSKGVYKSSDNGVNWINIYSEGRSNSIVKLDDILYIATENFGVALYEEGEPNWIKKNRGLPKTVVSEVYVINGYVYARTWQGLYRTNNEMEGWEDISYQSNRILALDLVSDNNVLYTSIYSNAIKTSTDKGKSWRNLNESLFEDKASFWRLRVKDNLMIAYAYNGGLVHLSNDYGENWKAIELPVKSYSLTNLRDLTIINGRILISMAFGTYYSDDLGENWSVVEDENIGESIGGALKYNFIDGNLFLGTMDNGLFYSENNGTNWNKFDFGDTLLNKLKIRAIEKYGDEFYIGTQDTGMLKWNSITKEVVWFSDSLSANGWIDDIYKLEDNIIVKTVSSIFLSKDNGKTWENTFPDMEETVNNLQLIDDTFFMGTWSGIFYTTLDKLDIVLSSVKTEPNISITAAYPQPANDILRLEFDNSILTNKILNADDITIHDSNGRLLTNQNISIEMNKELIWHCKDVVAGVYFVSVASKTFKVVIN